MTDVKLNFLNESEKFNTKFFPSEENPVITICGKGFTKREPNTPAKFLTRYNFSSFAYPNLNTLFNCYLPRRNHVEDQQSFPSDRALIIVVDNSFDIYDPNGVPLTVEDSISPGDFNYAYNPNGFNYVFIDHHLYESKAGHCDYHSNSIMIYDNFRMIFQILQKIITSKQIDYVGVLFHTDLDGIGSGLMIAKILRLIQEGRVYTIEDDILSVGLAMVLGEYGDISPDKKDMLMNIFKPMAAFEDGLPVKFEYLSKNIARFFKAIRPVIDIKSHIRENDDIEGLRRKYNELTFKYGLTYNEFLTSYEAIKSTFNKFVDINDLTITCFLSSLIQNPINKRIISLVQQEIDEATDGYLRPDTPQVEVSVKFTNIENSPEYKLLFIDSPLDIGRSVMWTYKGRLQYFKDSVEYKKFNMANYLDGLPHLKKLCNNICCYNLFSGKLSLHSSDDSAFRIGKAFGGGGHGNLEDGKSSLGSVAIDFDTLNKNCVIIEKL